MTRFDRERLEIGNLAGHFLTCVFQIAPDAPACEDWLRRVWMETALARLDEMRAKVVKLMAAEMVTSKEAADLLKQLDGIPPPGNPGGEGCD